MARVKGIPKRTVRMPAAKQDTQHSDPDAPNTKRGQRATSSQQRKRYHQHRLNLLKETKRQAIGRPFTEKRSMMRRPIDHGPMSGEWLSYIQYSTSIPYQKTYADLCFRERYS